MRKQKKIIEITYEETLSVFTIGNLQASPEEGKLQRLFQREVGLNSSKWGTSKPNLLQIGR